MGCDIVSARATGLALTLLLAGIAPAAAATLVIHVGHISPRGGVLRLGLYDAAGYARDVNPVKAADVAAHAPETAVTLHDVPPGHYAIEAYQDMNGNGEMDYDWLGLPLEPFGFSRDARPGFSKPGFSAVEFAVTEGTDLQAFHLQAALSPLAEE
jgi:uncharacterized protein (DUF2141 family)